MRFVHTYIRKQPLKPYQDGTYLGLNDNYADTALYSNQGFLFCVGKC